MANPPQRTHLIAGAPFIESGLFRPNFVKCQACLLATKSPNPIRAERDRPNVGLEGGSVLIGGPATNSRSGHRQDRETSPAGAHAKSRGFGLPLETPSVSWTGESSYASFQPSPHNQRSFDVGALSPCKSHSLPHQPPSRFTELRILIQKLHACSIRRLSCSCAVDESPRTVRPVRNRSLGYHLDLGSDTIAMDDRMAGCHRRTRGSLRLSSGGFALPSAPAGRHPATFSSATGSESRRAAACFRSKQAGSRPNRGSKGERRQT